MRHSFLCIFFFFAFSVFGEAPSTLLQHANESYKKGLEASTWQERLTSLNEALFLYTKIEEQVGPSPQINQVLGDVYFELTAYPWSILYYERSLKQNPNDPLLLNKLKNAQAKLGIDSSHPEDKSYWRLAFLDSLISQSMRLEYFFWGSVLTLLFAAFLIWHPHPFLKRGLLLSGALTTFLLLTYFALFYFTPIEGIVVSASGLYRESNRNEAQLIPIPLAAGEKVRVIDEEQQGYWLKIIDPKGKLGYIPSDSIRII